HIDQEVALYVPEKHRSHIHLYGQDPGVFGLAYASWVYWLLGFPDTALRYCQDAITTARDLAHPFNLTWSLAFAAWFHPWRREARKTQEWAEAAIALASEHGFQMSLAMATTFRGWALAEQDQLEEGIGELRRGLDAWKATGVRL